MLEDAHFKAREALITHEHPGVGELVMQNVFPKLSATPGQVRSAAPELGQHNAEVYADWLGLSDAEQQQLKERGIL
ncbi:CoA transferase [Nitritalea halalkaliphila]|uniref:CoA transferase n=1 Tax=Nitritalea halalkaliphila TaxID=590849 RepID=UPI00373FD4B1